MEVLVILCILINAIFWQCSFCQEKSIYGIILAKSINHTHGVIYNVTFNSQSLSHNKKKVYSVTKLSIQHPDTAEIIKEAMVSPTLKGVPIQQIFLQLFYSRDYIDSLTNDKFDQTYAIDQKLIENYMSYLGLTKIDRLNVHLFNLIEFGYYSIDIENEKLDKNIIMIYTPTDLFIGFFVSNGYNLSPQIISKVKYNSQDYSIVAKRFLCAWPLTVNYLIYTNLINNVIKKKGSEENNEIEHPCITTKKFVILKLIRADNACVETSKIKEPYKFVGAFNILKCWKLIEDAITDKQFLLKFKTDILNFADVNLPLLKNDHKTLKLYTLSSLNLHMISGDIESALNLLVKKKCKTVEEETEIEARNISCFQIVYMKYLLTNVLGFSGKNYIVSNKLPDSFTGILMFADPRVGYSPYSESSVVISTETVDKSSTTSPHLTMIFTDETVITLPTSEQITSSSTDETIKPSTTPQQQFSSTIKSPTTSQQITSSSTDETIKSPTTSQQQISSTEDETLITSIAYEHVTTSVSDTQIYVSNIDQPITTTTKPHRISTVLIIDLGIFVSCLLLCLVLIIVIHFKRWRTSRFERNL